MDERARRARAARIRRARGRIMPLLDSTGAHYGWVVRRHRHGVHGVYETESAAIDAALRDTEGWAGRLRFGR